MAVAPYPTQSARTWAQESYHDDLFARLKAEWIGQGIRVILPPMINGFWYMSYAGNFPWSHFEAK